jgi:DNA primase
VVCDAAKRLRDRLMEQGLTSFVKMTGSRALPVLVPLKRFADFGVVRAFAREVAKGLVQSDPEHLTTDVWKEKREGRFFWLRHAIRTHILLHLRMLCGRAMAPSGGSPEMERIGQRRT